MKWQLLNQDSGHTYAVVFSTGDEVMRELTRFAKQQELAASTIDAIGAFGEVVLGYFDWTKKDYIRTEIHEQVELLSLAGNITLEEGKPKIHAHVVVGARDGLARGGHLLSGTVRPTLELIIRESPKYLRRKFDSESGLALIALE